MQAGRDQNYVPTGLASDASGVGPLRVDPVSGRLLIDIAVVTDSSAPPSVSRAGRDGNDVPVGLAVLDGTSTVHPLIVDSRNGYLYVDIVIE